MKEHLKIMGLSTVYWIWIVGLILVGALIGGLVYGIQNNIIRFQQVRTTGFIQAQIDHMSKNLTAFDKNNVDLAKYSDNTTVVKALNSQQMGIVIDTWEAYDQIPQDAKDAVPATIMQFLSSHPRGWQP